MNRTSLGMGLGVVLGAGLCAVTGTSVAATVRGEIRFTGDCASNPAYCVIGTGQGTYHDSRSLDLGSNFVGSTQLGSIDIDFAAGTIRGSQSALVFGDPSLSVSSEVRGAFVSPVLQVVSLNGAQPGVSPYVGFYVTMSANFGADFNLGPQDWAYNTFNAQAGMRAVGSSVPFASAAYSYQWTRSLGIGGDDYSHSGGGSGGCANCFGELIVPNDGIHEYMTGFDGVTLHFGRSDLEVGQLFQLDLLVSSLSNAIMQTASGDWSHTIDIGYTMPDGFGLAELNGPLLGAWKLNTVPLPAGLPLFGAALLTLARRAQRKARSAHAG